MELKPIGHVRDRGTEAAATATRSALTASYNRATGVTPRIEFIPVPALDACCVDGAIRYVQHRIRVGEAGVEMRRVPSTSSIPSPATGVND